MFSDNPASPAYMGFNGGQPGFDRYQHGSYYNDITDHQSYPGDDEGRQKGQPYFSPYMFGDGGRGESNIVYKRDATPKSHLRGRSIYHGRGRFPDRNQDWNNRGPFNLRGGSRNNGVDNPVFEENEEECDVHGARHIHPSHTLHLMSRPQHSNLRQTQHTDSYQYRDDGRPNPSPNVNVSYLPPSRAGVSGPPSAGVSGPPPPKTGVSGPPPPKTGVSGPPRAGVSGPPRAGVSSPPPPRAGVYIVPPAVGGSRDTAPPQDRDKSVAGCDDGGVRGDISMAGTLSKLNMRHIKKLMQQSEIEDLKSKAHSTPDDTMYETQSRFTGTQPIALRRMKLHLQRPYLGQEDPTQLSSDAAVMMDPSASLSITNRDDSHDKPLNLQLSDLWR